MLRLAFAGVTAFVAIVVASILALGSFEGVPEALRSVRWWAVALSLLCALGSVIAEGTAIAILVGDLRPGRVLAATRAYLAGSFVANVTPWSSGGGPAWLWALSREGVRGAHAAAVVTGRSIAVVTFFAIVSLASALLAPGIIDLSRVVSAAALAPAGLIAFALLVVRCPEALGKRIASLLSTLARLLSAESLQSLADRTPDALASFSAALRDLWAHRRGAFVASVATIGVSRTLQLLPIPVLLITGGHALPFPGAFLGMMLVWVLASVSPTPSGEGVAQAAVLAVFSGYADADSLAANAIVWRASVYYPVLLLGGVFFARLMRRRREGAGTGRARRTSGEVDAGSAGKSAPLTRGSDGR